MRGHGSRVLLSAGMVVGTAGLAGALAPAAHAAGSHPHGRGLPGIGRLLPKPHQNLPEHGGTVTSLNWSGYAVTSAANDITGVTTQFQVPSAGLIPPGFAATWGGIGGYNTSDLIQAGVGENSLVSNPVTGPQYYAWYELLPASETPISNCTGGDASCTVTPGDNVTVSISESAPGSGSWNINIADGSKWSWATTVPYVSSHSSAEWILEAPTVALQTVLAPVGIVHFGPDDTYTDGSGTHPISAGNPTQIALSPGLINEATPSALAADGESFNDCAYQQSCPTP